jgi:ADP-heptose:LPS heptosyltransferase
MVFVGTEEEHGNFNGFCLPKFSIPHYKTPTLLQMAQVIAGSKVFVGNQSAPLAVAHGLCHNAVVETWPANPNCCLLRPNAIYCGGNTAKIPEEWLA